MTLLGSMTVALLLTPVVAFLASRLGVVDRPGALKVHTRPVPYLGGLAVFAAASLSAVGGSRAYLLPLALALALGVADDIADLPARLRLGAEVVIGLSAAAVVDTKLPDPLGAVAVVVVTVVLVNAVNLLDGLDALAAGVAVVGTAGFAGLLTGDGRLLALAVTGGLAGFLVFNRPPARIYLGDGGAYLIGATLALLLAAAWGHGRSVDTGIAALLLVAVPGADLLVTIIRRLRGHRPLFLGDRSHIYDQLVDRGRSRSGATLSLVAAQLVLVALALGVGRAGVAPALIAVVAAVVVGAIVLAERGFLRPTCGDGGMLAAPAGERA